MVEYSFLKKGTDLFPGKNFHEPLSGCYSDRKSGRYYVARDQRLKEVATISAEDTRSARRLLNATDIPLAGRVVISLGDHNETAVVDRLLKRLMEGEDLVVISDGGTPLVSNPGFRLVRAAIDAEIPVVPLPGPCAVVAALIASGLPMHAFLFRGFLPKKEGARMKILENLREREETLIISIW